MVFINFFPTLFSWWYSKGISSLFDFLTVFFIHMTDYFSPLDIVLNIFKPWKRNVSSMGRGLSSLKDFIEDNLVSRLIGFFMRSVLLIIYIGFLVFYILFLVVSVTFWLFMPAWAILSFIYIFL